MLRTRWIILAVLFAARMSMAPAPDRRIERTKAVGRSARLQLFRHRHPDRPLSAARVVYRLSRQACGQRFGANVALGGFRRDGDRRRYGAGQRLARRHDTGTAGSVEPRRYALLNAADQDGRRLGPAAGPHCLHRTWRDLCDQLAAGSRCLGLAGGHSIAAEFGWSSADACRRCDLARLPAAGRRGLSSAAGRSAGAGGGVHAATQRL